MRLLVFALALVIAACTPQAPQQAPSQQQANGASTSASGPSNKGDGQAAAPAAAETPDNKGDGQSAAPARPAADTIDAGFMIGRWGDNGDCTKDIVINSDSTFRSYTGGEGRWSLRGNTLSLSGDNGTFDMRLELINHDTLRITNPDGSVGTSQRCD